MAVDHTCEAQAPSSTRHRKKLDSHILTAGKRSDMPPDREFQLTIRVPAWAYRLRDFIRDNARLRASISAILAVLASVGTLHLTQFFAIQSGLDHSWITVLGEAAARGYLFGRDIVFSGGPLSAFYTRYFDSVLWPVILVADVLVTAVLAWCCARLSSNWLVALLLPFTFLIAALPLPDVAFLSVPALAALVVLLRPGTSYAFVALAAAATAFIILAKFSPIAIALIALVAIDIVFLRERRLPIGTISFAAILVGLFAAIEGTAAYFPDFIRYSVESSAGYAAAMGIKGDTHDLVTFIVCALIFGAVMSARAYRWVKSGSFLDPLLLTVVVGIVCFTGFKVGFIRHDVHRLIGWGALAVMIAAYIPFEERRLTRWLVVTLCLITAGISLHRAFTQFDIFLKARIYAVGTGLTQVRTLVSDPHGWLQGQYARMDQGRIAVRTALPLPPIKGSVDTLAPNQSALIAAGLDYRPRFTVQDYTAYTPLLSAKNHRVLVRRASARSHLLRAGSDR